MRIKQTSLRQMPVLMFLIGIGLTIVSMFYVSSYLAILGVSIIFWGIILLYITPSKYVPLSFLNASAKVDTTNIERLILEFDLNEKGIYLPPQNLKNMDSSLIFIPETPITILPTSEETNDKQFTKNITGAFITPPGYGLSRLLEEELGFSFTKTSLDDLQIKLPKLLIEDLEITENIEFQIENNTIKIKLIDNIFNEICCQTDSNPKTHQQIGCLLSSTLACTLAKATGKPIIIQNETRNQETKTTTITYQILEYSKIEE